MGWQTDEALRRGLPWGALTPGSPAYPQVCRSVAGFLRKLADEVEEEAETAKLVEYEPGVVGAALSELNSDFVKSRMPTPPKREEDEECDIIQSSSFVRIADPS